MTTQEPIGAFARRTGLSVRALRLYDQLGLLRPAAVDRWSGYRFYEPGQATTATLVRALRALDVPLRDIAAVLADPARAHQLVDAHLALAEERIVAVRRAAARAHRIVDQEEPVPTAATIASSVLSDALAQVMCACAGADLDHPELAAVLFEGTDTGLRLVASDSYRMAVRDLPGVSMLAPGEQVLVPLTSLEAVAARLPTAGQVDMSLTEAGDALAVDLDGERLSASLVDGEFPDYRRPRLEGTSFVAGRRAVLDAVHAAAGDAPGDALVAITFASPAAVAAVTADGARGAAHRVDGRWDGDQATMWFRAAFLADAVASMPGDEVSIEVTGQYRPIAVTTPATHDLVHLLMPVRSAAPAA